MSFLLVDHPIGHVMHNWTELRVTEEDTYRAIHLEVGCSCKVDPTDYSKQMYYFEPNNAAIKKHGILHRLSECAGYGKCSKGFDVEAVTRYWNDDWKEDLDLMYEEMSKFPGITHVIVKKKSCETDMLWLSDAASTIREDAPFSLTRTYSGELRPSPIRALPIQSDPFGAAGARDVSPTPSSATTHSLQGTTDSETLVSSEPGSPTLSSATIENNYLEMYSPTHSTDGIYPTVDTIMARTCTPPVNTTRQPQGGANDVLDWLEITSSVGTSRKHKREEDDDDDDKTWPLSREEFETMANVNRMLTEIKRRRKNDWN